MLVNANTGIAVGMASSICSFNLRGSARPPSPSCATRSTTSPPRCSRPTSPAEDRFSTTAPRSTLSTAPAAAASKSAPAIPTMPRPTASMFPASRRTTSVEAIIEKSHRAGQAGKCKEIADIRDETGLDGLKITIDLKRGVDPDRLMQRLYRMTPLEDTFSCNFNVLIVGVPRVMGVRELLEGMGGLPH